MKMKTHDAHQRNAQGRRERTRGIRAVLVPTEPLRAAIAAHNGWEAAQIKPEQTWLIDRGEGEGSRYAITNTEGVTHMPEKGPFEVYSEDRGGLYPIPVADLVTAAKGGEVWDLADIVRIHSDRLEMNFSLTYRWADRQS